MDSERQSLHDKHRGERGFVGVGRERDRERERGG
jgi:hypothetical protein